MVSHTQRLKQEAFSCKTLEEVRRAYKRVLSIPEATKATYNILVYKVGKDIGWVDDEEYGAGHFLATWMEREKLMNVAVVCTRQYGGRHLGTCRFELMREVASEAYLALTEKSTR